jgi:hypothetical protein
MSRNINQIKNPFDKILSLNFNLGPLKVNTYVSKGIKFSNDYQKDSYNFKEKWMWKTLRR